MTNEWRRQGINPSAVRWTGIAAAALITGAVAAMSASGIIPHPTAEQIARERNEWAVSSYRAMERKASYPNTQYTLNTRN